MVMLPVTTCARRLGIHPKTFNHWLTQANFPFAPHPTDARIKCVAEEHFLEVARQHDRPLQSSPPSVLLDGASLPSSSQEYEAPSLQADLIQKLSCLETKVSTLQEHLAKLTLALLQERERSVERRLSALETIATELLGKPVLSTSLPASQSPETGTERGCAVHVPRLLNPAEQRVRSRMPPLIEYSAHGDYVIVSSQEGELHLVPDSTEWFDWLTPSRILCNRTLPSRSSIPFTQNTRWCRLGLRPFPRSASLESKGVALLPIENPIIGDQSEVGRRIAASTTDGASTIWASLIA